MLPVTARSPSSAPNQLDAQRAPTQAEFNAFVKLLENGNTAAALDQLARQPKLVTMADDYHNTALHWAAKSGCSSQVIDALLKAGANLEAKNKYANLEAKNSYGETSLIYAAYKGHCEALDALLQAGCNLEAKNKDGNTALLLAAADGHRGAIDTLLKAGANLTATNKNGDTALIVAAIIGDRATADTLQLAYASRGLALSGGEQRALDDAGIAPLTPAQMQAARAIQQRQAEQAASPTLPTRESAEWIGALAQHFRGRLNNPTPAQQREAQPIQQGKTPLETHDPSGEPQPAASVALAPATPPTGAPQKPVAPTSPARPVRAPEPSITLSVRAVNTQPKPTKDQARIRLLEVDNVRLRDTADQLVADKRSLEQQLATQQTQHAEQSKHIQQAETALKTLKGTYDRALQQQQAEQLTWQGVVKTLTAERDQASQAHQQSLVRAQQLDQEAADQAKQHQQREAQHATILQRQGGELEALRQQHGDVTRALAEANAQLQSQLAENAQQRAAITALTQRNKEHEAELTAARNDIETLRTSNTALDLQAKQALSEGGLLRQAIDQLHQDHSAQQDRLRQDQNQLQSAHDELAKTLTDTRAQLTETLARAQAHEAETAQLRGASAQLATDKRSLEQRLADLQALRADQETRITQGEARVQALKQQVDDAGRLVLAKDTELIEVASQLAAHRDQSSRAYQDLLARQTRLEQEKADLVHQKEALAHQHEDLQVRVDLLQAERQRLLDKVPQADTLPETQRRLQQERAELDARQKQVANQAPSRSREHELKLLAEREQSLREQAERVNKQLRLFEAFGTTSRERVFTQFLKDIKRHADLQQARPEVFISYAWEDTGTPEGIARNATLQTKLLALQRYIEAIGCTVKLDLSDLHGDLKAYMAKLNECRYVVLIGTTRLKQRIEERPNSPVAYEFGQILAKAADPQQSDCLIPLMLEGKYNSTFPTGVTAHLVRDFRDATATWPQQMAQLAAPNRNAGLIPQLLGLYGPQRQTAGYAAYERLVEHFQLALEKAEREDSAKVRDLAHALV